MTFDLNTPRAPSGPERIADAMRRDTAAPSSLGLDVLCYVSASDAWRFMLGAPLVDLVWSCSNLADLARSWQVLAYFSQNLVCQS